MAFGLSNKIPVHLEPQTALLGEAGMHMFACVNNFGNWNFLNVLP
jgi:hypothetical protein